jgi:hypothetical protein
MRLGEENRHRWKAQKMRVKINDTDRHCGLILPTRGNTSSGIDAASL